MSPFKRWIVGSLALVGFASFMQLISVAQPRFDDAPPCCWDMWDPGWTQRYLWGPGHMGRMQRQRMPLHWTFMHEGVPEEYRGRTSTIAISEQAISEGAALYAERCASCHGPPGLFYREFYQLSDDEVVDPLQHAKTEGAAPNEAQKQSG